MNFWKVTAAFAAGGILASCRGTAPPAANATPTAGEWFTDEAQARGLDFVHTNGMAGRFYMPEIMGSGVALFDYDNDGDLDIYFADGRPLDQAARNRLASPPAATPAGGRLFRNDLIAGSDGTLGMRFTDVTVASGIVAADYGMGVATGDIDNDGWTDLYLTNVGRSQMFRNNGNGTFTDVSTTSGTRGTGWAVSASFFDYDRDGWLDLYVGNYLRYSVEADQLCHTPAGGRDYCAPQVYRAQRDRLYHNLGHGTFADVTTTALRDPAFGPALGVITADFNGDGWIDIYVANDSQENQLWINQRDGTFVNEALIAGVAMTADGKAEAGMGLDAGDSDNDGDEDLFVTSLTGEGSNLYVNNGEARFTDRSAASGLGPSTMRSTGFGTGWFDADNDGWLDILSVNGLVRATEEQLSRGFPYDQRKHFFLNRRNGQFDEASGSAGSTFAVSEVGRGAAFGDIDNDGDIDIVISNDAGPARLLINHRGNRNHWIGLRLVRADRGPTAGPAAGRDLIGTRVGIVRRIGPTLWRRAHSDGSYASANDPRVLVGLGGSSEAVTVRVQWPDGRSEERSGLPVDRWTTLTQGEGR